jgi:hypothetical protein
MDDQGSEKTASSQDPEAPPSDLDEGLHVGFVTAEEFEQRVVETHKHGRRHVTSQHIYLDQDEYTPEELTLLIGTSLEVVIRAIRYGDIKARRVGHDVIAIKHEDVTDWLRRRGGV